jgi:hypothetical protein
MQGALPLVVVGVQPTEVGVKWPGDMSPLKGVVVKLWPGHQCASSDPMKNRHSSKNAWLDHYKLMRCILVTK